MTVSYISDIVKLTCLATDIKPVKLLDGFPIPDGSLLTEMDTQTKYTFDATAGWKIGATED